MDDYSCDAFNELINQLTKIWNNVPLYQYQKDLIEIIKEKELQEFMNNQLNLYEQQPCTYKLLSSLDLELFNSEPLDVNTQISNIKRQLKHEKNPLEIKNLNRKMNELIKEKNKK